MFLGNRLSNLRKGKSMTQKDLANLLNLDRASIANIERGRTIPTLKILEQLSSIFNVSIYFFLDSEVPKPLEPFSIVPETFINKEDALSYLSKHTLLLDLDLNKLDENDLINFSNEIQAYIQLLLYKYKYKNKL